MKWIVSALKWILVAIISFSVLAKAPSNSIQLKNEVEAFSQNDLVKMLNQFVAQSAPSRLVGASGHAKAEQFLQDSIRGLDPKGTGKLSLKNFQPNVEEGQRFYQQDFEQKVEGKIPRTHPDYQKWLRFTSYMKQTVQRLSQHQGTNLIWEKSGLNTDKVLVIMAHYDTITHDPRTLIIPEKDPMPGANYNATGVTIALGLIRLLARLDLNYTVQVVFLDWQGIGFLGSYEYARELKQSGKQVMGFVNLEMLGQDTSYFDKSKKLGNMCAYGRGVDMKFLRQLEQHGSRMGAKISFIPREQGFENSDNVRLWEQGFLGLTFSQNWEEDFNPKFFQSSQDTPETLNHQTFYAAYKYLAGAVGGFLLDLTR